jgi:PAS domain-containing protein
MRESSYLATTADMLAVGMVCIDGVAGLVYANELACRLLGAESPVELAARRPDLDKQICRNVSAAAGRTALDLSKIGRRLRLEVRPCSTDGQPGRVLLLKDVSTVSAARGLRWTALRSPRWSWDLALC